MFAIRKILQNQIPLTCNLTNSHHNLTPKEVLLMQQECMYFRASPKYGFNKTNNSYP